jgi:Flp pilus assembly protein TadB
MVPFGLALVLWFINPEYLMSVTDGGPICTAVIICAVLGLVFTSYFIMMRIADIEV